jgi:glutamate carboxypeptidase
MTTAETIQDAAVERAAILLEDLCGLSSASGDAHGIRRCAERLAGELETFGFTATVEDEPGLTGRGQPVLVARTGGTRDGYILLVGHLDTVLPAIAPHRFDDRLEGTGALDMKGGFAALVGALSLRRGRGSAVPDDLVLVAVPDEEVGGPISENAMRSWGDGARAVLVLEPGRAAGDAETIVTGRRGLTVWRLEAQGRAAHSGLAYADGRSALAAAAEWAAAVQGLSEIGTGPFVNVGRIVGGDSEFVRELGEEHRFIGTSQRLNVVADRCLAEGEARYLTLVDRDRVLAEMSRLADLSARRWGVEMGFREVEEILPVPPSASGSRLANRLVEAAADDGWTLELEPDRGGVSFPNFLPDPASVPVLDGLGPVGDGMHTREEYVSLQSLERRIRLIAALIGMLAETSC